MTRLLRRLHLFGLSLSKPSNQESDVIFTFCLEIGAGHSLSFPLLPGLCV